MSQGTEHMEHQNYVEENLNSFPEILNQLIQKYSQKATGNPQRLKQPSTIFCPLQMQGIYL